MLKWEPTRTFVILSRALSGHTHWLARSTNTCGQTRNKPTTPESFTELHSCWPRLILRSRDSPLRVRWHGRVANITGRGGMVKQQHQIIHRANYRFISCRVEARMVSREDQGEGRSVGKGKRQNTFTCCTLSLISSLWTRVYVFGHTEMVCVSEWELRIVIYFSGLSLYCSLDASGDHLCVHTRLQILLLRPSIIPFQFRIGLP